MKKGYLSQYFEAVAAKRLTAVEVNTKKSNQHEFNGSDALKRVFGTYDTGEKTYYETRFVWMAEENETVSADGTLSWYDSRFKVLTRNAEWRLFYPSNDVMDLAREDDLLFVAKRPDNTVLAIVVAANTTTENQLLWLFGVPVQKGKEFVYQDITDKEDKEVDFAVRFILEELGIEIEEPEADYLDSILAKLDGKLPTTKEFSLLTRQTLKDVNCLDDPDNTLMAWMNHEEKLFRRIERHEVEKRLHTGFISDAGADVDGFLKFSLSVQNRRKSRAGLALENHLEAIFQDFKIRYSRVAETEQKVKPDFLFPGGEEYHDPNFAPGLLTMLGVKTTCKDRWRQVLSEAKKIQHKHLLTLEPGISENQTDEMRSQQLQLVLPSSIHETYKDDQKKWLMSVSDFVKLVSEKQKHL